MLGVLLLLACNRTFVVCYFGVRARETDRRAEFALRGVCRERGRLVSDAYSASLWFCLADPGWHRDVACLGCLPGAQELACLRVPELAPLYFGLWAAGQGVLPPVKVSPDRPEHALHAGAGGSSADEVRIVSAELLEGEYAGFCCV